MDANGAIVAVIAFAVVAAIVLLFVVWLREGRDDGRQPAHDPCDGAYRESLMVRDETGYLTPDQAEAWISLLEAEPEPMVKYHCPLCIIAMCDEQGIPLEAVRTAGERRYCVRHKDSILARARQGA